MRRALLLLASLLPVAPLAAQSAADTRPVSRADRELDETVGRYAGDVRRCYESEGLRRDPAVAGTLELTIEILPTGVVERAMVSATTLRGEAAEPVRTCVEVAARNWRYERGPYVVETVAYPFELRPAKPVAATTPVAPPAPPAPPAAPADPATPGPRPARP